MDAQPYVRIAEIEIDSAQCEAFQAALREEIDASVRIEPGVLALHAVSDKGNPARIVVFEIYADVTAYAAHLEAPHFKTYKAVTANMVVSLKLTETAPIALSTKAR
jgi:quinol monooxygenase YgiN